MHILSLQSGFELPSHEFLAVACVPLTKFQQITAVPHSKASLWWCLTLLFLSQVILPPM